MCHEVDVRLGAAVVRELLSWLSQGFFCDWVIMGLVGGYDADLIGSGRLCRLGRPFRLCHFGRRHLCFRSDCQHLCLNVAVSWCSIRFWTSVVRCMFYAFARRPFTMMRSYADGGQAVGDDDAVRFSIRHSSACWTSVDSLSNALSFVNNNIGASFKVARAMATRCPLSRISCCRSIGNGLVQSGGDASIDLQVGRGRMGLRPFAASGRLYRTFSNRCRQTRYVLRRGQIRRRQSSLMSAMSIPSCTDVQQRAVRQKWTTGWRRSVAAAERPTGDAFALSDVEG